jgi:hypothetical protein
MLYKITYSLFYNPKPAIDNSLVLACSCTICLQLVKSNANLLPKVPSATSKFVATSWNFVGVAWEEDTRIAIRRALRKFVPT